MQPDPPAPPPKAHVCPACGSSAVKLATDAIYAVYLRCNDCFNVWSMTKDDYRRTKSDANKK